MWYNYEGNCCDTEKNKKMTYQGTLLITSLKSEDYLRLNIKFT